MKKNIKVLLKVLSFFSIIGCAAFNLDSLIGGSAASRTSGYLFGGFILLWIVIVILARKDRKTIVFISNIWKIISISSLILFLSNLKIFSAIWFIPFIALFNGALYGITYWVDSKLIAAGVHLIIALAFISACFIVLKRERSEHYEKK
ncbi:hypothetical protein [Abyssisolibacter fermentans]|uniref:hypothetical protein n=1 Tax=Abyssisolibacter fermentans TaxID=1766203 RepID=UPI0012E3D581|nr:hypothetical protein [Abyssisolibacter fermentans]